MPPPSPKRFQCDLTEQLKADLVTLKLTTGDRTNARLVQKAIRLNALIREKINQGCQIIIRHPSGKEQRLIDV